jgi:hypothetical protein
MRAASTIVRFPLTVQVPWRALRGEAGVWIGICDALKLTAQATTWIGLTRAVEEIMQDYIRDLATEGRLEQFLEEYGLEPNDFPRPIPAEGVEFDVPTPILPSHAGA